MTTNGQPAAAKHQLSPAKHDPEDCCLVTDIALEMKRPGISPGPSHFRLPNGLIRSPFRGHIEVGCCRLRSLKKLVAAASAVRISLEVHSAATGRHGRSFLLLRQLGDHRLGGD